MLPGFAPIPLAGLSEQLATLRLGVEPALRDLFIRVTKLPLVKTGADGAQALRLRSVRPSDLDVRAGDQRAGAGGLRRRPGRRARRAALRQPAISNFKLVVGRDGRVSFPELGPVSVAGQTFDSAQRAARVAGRAADDRRARQRHDGRYAHDPRVRARRRQVSPAPTPSAASARSLRRCSPQAACRPIGSLRNIELKRHGELVRRLDLYDMLIRGDTTDDARLLPGDVIFIPPVGPTVTRRRRSAPAGDLRDQERELGRRRGAARGRAHARGRHRQGGADAHRRPTCIAWCCRWT